jgi:hypothetical protein
MPPVATTALSPHNTSPITRNQNSRPPHLINLEHLSNFRKLLFCDAYALPPLTRASALHKRHRGALVLVQSPRCVSSRIETGIGEVLEDALLVIETVSDLRIHHPRF